MGAETSNRNSLTRQHAFTLIEVMVAITLSTVILSAIYLTLVTALESWQYTRDELALQQTMNSLLEDVLEGSDWQPGFRAALEINRAGLTEVGFVPPWSEVRTVGHGPRSFQTEHFVKPGAGLPTAELQVSPTEPFRSLPVSLVDPDNFSERSWLKPDFELVPGALLRFSYYPDADREPELGVSVQWDPETGLIIREYGFEREELGKNLFGVEITDCRFRYFDQNDRVLEESGEVPTKRLPAITAVELQLTGRMGSHTMTLVGMVALRNSLRHGGMLILRKGLAVSIPDSRAIRNLVLTNLSGLNHSDELQLEIRPSSGQEAYRVSIRFERYGQIRPVIAQVTVEYPPGQAVYTDRPRTDSALGLDLLSLGPGGLYDYDDDPDVEDVVLVEGDAIELTVTKMDIHGGACFIQP